MLQVVCPVGIDNTAKSKDTILKCLIIEESHAGRFDNMRLFAKVVERGSLAGAAVGCYRCFDSGSGAVLLPDRGINLRRAGPIGHQSILPRRLRADRTTVAPCEPP